jgi:hypothetical protein
MERVAFLIEETGERIGCLLNPASFAVRRHAGVHPRRSIAGQLSGAGLTDDPLLFTGGGHTEPQLDLLFDVSLSGTPPTSTDVRDFTGPLSRLAENANAPDRSGRPPVVRFVWGKSWNVPGVVATVAERFERFDAGGTPQRCWLRMRLVRVTEQQTTPSGTDPGLPGELLPTETPTAPTSPTGVVVHEVIGAGPDTSDATDASGEEAAPTSGERLDEIASRYYGNPALWKLLAELNDIDDPLHVPPGTLLRIPPLPGGGTPT